MQHCCMTEKFVLQTPTLLAFLFKLEGDSSARSGASLLSNPYEAGTTQCAGWSTGWLEGYNALRWSEPKVEN